ncbi:MAG: porin [Burkholderiales bacterium]
MRTSTISKAVAMAVISLSGAPVFAQSTLTMYGLLDQAVEWSNGTKNASNNQRGSTGWALVNGISNGSRFGVRGSEDLGGGLKAIFAIETRFNVDNGDTGGGRGIPPNPSDKKTVSDTVKFWNAQSWVGLDSSSWGRLTAGRQYVPLYNALANVDATGYRYYNNESQFFNNRLDNALLYQTPTFAGLVVQAMYAFGENLAPTVNTATNAYPQDQGNSYGLGARWDQGDFSLGGAYMNYGVDKSGYALFSSRVEWGAGGAWRFSKTGQIGVTYLTSSLGTGVTSADNNIKNGVLADTSANTDFIMVSGRIGLGSGVLYGNYVYKDPNNYKNLKAQNLFGITYDYPLSKRTDVYLAFGQEGDTKWAGSGTAALPYSYGTANRAALGLRHLF